MATLAKLSKAKAIYRIDPGLDPGEQEFRVFYASPRLVQWMADDLPKLGSTWKIEVNPLEQLDALLAVYGAGDTLTFGWQFKPLVHIREGIWELKTADLRIFGSPRAVQRIGILLFRRGREPGGNLAWAAEHAARRIFLPDKPELA